jgi:serine protease Do
MQAILGYLFLSLSLPLSQVGGSTSERWTTEALVYQACSPSVVSINAFVVNMRPESLLEFNKNNSRSEAVSQGTGVVIDSRGLVITNAHVVKNPYRTGEVICKLNFASPAEREEVLARVVSLDENSDLALLKIYNTEENIKYTPILFATENDLLIGEKVIAIGSPYGNQHSVTSGILSGINRDITVKESFYKGRTFENLLQTDAAINPGNSGGPLLNVAGELIGINNATITSADGIGYAIPIAQVNSVFRDKLSTARVWFGIQLKQDNYLEIEKIAPRSPAASQGLKKNDVILSINDISVENRQELNNELLLIDAGEEFSVKVQRKNLELTYALRLPDINSRDTVGLLGFEAIPDVVTFRDKRGWRSRYDVLRITKVYQDSPASRIGLEVDDAVHALRMTNFKGWAPVKSMAQMISMVKSSTFDREDYNIIWSKTDGTTHQGKLILE